jgi:tRNA G18 (ribose-2'-O)-methylase SpoU
MPVIPIAHIEDARLDDYRNVSDGALLRRSNLFVAEGRLVVRRLLASPYRPVSLLLNDASFRSFEVEFRARFEEMPVYVGSTDALASIVGYNLHRGCLALAARPPERDVTDVARAASLLLVLEGVTDPDNVGSAFRNAAAFAAGGVLIAGCCDPLYRKAIRTSMGHVLQLPYASTLDIAGTLRMLKAAGFVVVALTPAADATPLPDFVRSQTAAGKIAVLAGSEADGLSAAAEAAADARVRIPMHRTVDSLNLATAIAIALDRLTEQRLREPFLDD